MVGPCGTHPDQPVQQPLQRAVRASGAGSGHQPSGSGRAPDFSDDYAFSGSMNAIARWIGNAVPVTLAESLGAAVMQAAA